MLHLLLIFMFNVEENYIMSLKNIKFAAIMSKHVLYVLHKFKMTFMLHIVLDTDF